MRTPATTPEIGRHLEPGHHLSPPSLLLLHRANGALFHSYFRPSSAARVTTPSSPPFSAPHRPPKSADRSRRQLSSTPHPYTTSPAHGSVAPPPGVPPPPHQRPSAQCSPCRASRLHPRRNPPPAAPISGEPLRPPITTPPTPFRLCAAAARSNLLLLCSGAAGDPVIDRPPHLRRSSPRCDRVTLSTRPLHSSLDRRHSLIPLTPTPIRDRPPFAGIKAPPPTTASSVSHPPSRVAAPSANRLLPSSPPHHAPSHLLSGDFFCAPQSPLLPLLPIPPETHTPTPAVGASPPTSMDRPPETLRPESVPPHSGNQSSTFHPTKPVASTSSTFHRTHRPKPLTNTDSTSKHASLPADQCVVPPIDAPPPRPYPPLQSRAPHCQTAPSLPSSMFAFPLHRVYVTVSGVEMC